MEAPEVRSMLLVAFVLTACRGSSLQSGAQASQAAPPPEAEAAVALNVDVPIAYPVALVEQRVEGDVTLRLFVDSMGKLIPESPRVAEPSGYPALDSAALAGATALRFAPAKRHGVPVATAFLQPVEFRQVGTTRTGTGTVTLPPTPAPTPPPAAAPPPSRPRPRPPVGRLKPGGLIVEATSGNTGVGLAIASAVKGYRCIFTMPDKMSQEKARLLRALGAEVIITPTAVPPDHPDNYIMKGRAIAAAHDNAIFADQHYNPVNPDVHYHTTGPEIWEQTSGKVTHFVCAPGTGGTVSGAGRYLKERNPKIRVIAGDPVGSIYTEYAKTHQQREGQPYKVEGIGGDKIPTSLHWDVIDEWISVTDKDAMLMTRRVAREEGLFVGGSTGVNVIAALEVARRASAADALVVTVLCDTGERYLSKVYNDEWLRENEMLESERVAVAQLLAAKNGSAAPPLVAVAPSATVRQALNLMSTYNVSQLPVLDGGDGVGAVFEQLLMARALEDPATLDKPVEDVMA